MHHLEGCNGGMYDLRNRYTYTFFVYDNLTYSDWRECKMFSLYVGALQKIFEKHFISKKQLKIYFKIANSEMYNNITKIDKQASMKVLQTLY